ncbi:transporter substrate-binding domain-containing protein [Sediminispirochaeta smaragdinae]|uniref:Extracellular solute-binding protein family 3 n=1 Tax=Sediminispirochaeta smaragdinae (strain DSM 11293 / JCM 15392 / SEBR 4228) TaxID=573413 RepID=E1R395_SEDSS|nr:transporter substrate-binding domain-containing protein [Sediminispirochaeta smaragdinae]ADK81526.1 extracellular solute-binding protein family 3 [Sediminispirochaeta smaragdinae DSM 11293]
MKKSRSYVLMLIWFVVLLSFFTACGAPPKEENTAENESQRNGGLIDEISRRGVLKVGMSTFVPWAMNDKNGQLIGFEIDVAKRLAKDLGVDVEFVPTKWSGIIPALLTGKFDVIIGGMGIRPERSLKVNFTIPYDYSGMAIVANKETAPGYGSLEEFDNPDVTVVARIGTTAADAAKKYMPNANIKLFDDEAQALQELKTGRAHAMVASAPLPAFQAIENSDTLYLPIPGTFTREPIGFAIRKREADALNVFNSWIRVVDSEGWLAERKAYWFESRDWQSALE